MSLEKIEDYIRVAKNSRDLFVVPQNLRCRHAYNYNREEIISVTNDQFRSARFENIEDEDFLSFSGYTLVVSAFLNGLPIIFNKELLVPNLRWANTQNVLIEKLKEELESRKFHFINNISLYFLRLADSGTEAVVLRADEIVQFIMLHDDDPDSLEYPLQVIDDGIIMGTTKPADEPVVDASEFFQIVDRCVYDFRSGNLGVKNADNKSFSVYVPTTGKQKVPKIEKCEFKAFGQGLPAIAIRRPITEISPGDVVIIKDNTNESKWLYYHSHECGEDKNFEITGYDVDSGTKIIISVQDGLLLGGDSVLSVKNYLGDKNSMKEILPLLLLSGKKIDTNTIMAMMMMSGEQDTNSMLPLLLMSGNAGGNNMLPLIMMMNGGKMDQSMMLPLMMMSGSGDQSGMQAYLMYQMMTKKADTAAPTK